MTITYPLSLPAVGGIRRIRLTARNVVGVSVSPFTLGQQVYQHQGQSWEADITLPPMKRADAEEWIAFLLSLAGRYGTFLLGDPAGTTARGALGGTPLVNGASQSGQSLAVDGWTASVTSILRAGDYIQIGSGTATRLHKVLKTVNSNGSGQTTLDIWPRLRETPADNAAVTTANCVGTFRLAGNATDYDINEASVYGIVFAAVEAI